MSSDKWKIATYIKSKRLHDIMIISPLLCEYSLRFSHVESVNLIYSTANITLLQLVDLSKCPYIVLVICPVVVRRKFDNE